MKTTTIEFVIEVLQELPHPEPESVGFVRDYNNTRGDLDLCTLAGAKRFPTMKDAKRWRDQYASAFHNRIRGIENGNPIEISKRQS